MSMNYIMIDRYLPTPLYAQLKSSILKALHEGLIAPGDRLPTEDELCERFGISRPVIRQAYSELISEGVIVRVKSKGSFIREKEIQSHFFQSLTSIEDELRRGGMVPQTQVITKDVILFDPKIYEMMKLDSSEKVFHVRLLYKGSDRPMALVDTYIPLRFFPGIENADFETRPLYQIFESDYNRYVIQARRTVAAIIVSDNSASLLNIAKGSAIHEVKTLATDIHDQILEYSRAVYPGDRNSFDIMIYKHQR